MLDGLFGWMLLAGFLVLPVVGVGCLLRGGEKHRRRMARTAAVFLGTLALMVGGSLILNLFGLAWRYLSWGILLGAFMISFWVGICFTMEVFLNGEWLGMPWPIRWTVKSVVSLLFGAVFLLSLWLFYFACLLVGYSAGQVVEFRGQTVVKISDGWLDPHDSYYAYHGPLVRGAELIYDSDWSRPAITYGREPETSTPPNIVEDTEGPDDVYELSPEEQEIEDGYQAIYRLLSGNPSETADIYYGAKPGSSRSVLFEDGSGIDYLVYDRKSKNGSCGLYVRYRCGKDENGTCDWNNSAIADVYAYVCQDGSVVSSGKMNWGDIGSAEYQAVTGEF